VEFPEIPATVSAAANTRNAATLQQVQAFALFQHRGGFFGRIESAWYQQSNRGYAPSLPGDEFWQFNLFLGYRFPRRAAELRVGLLNLADRDYRLNPLNLYLELPRDRTLTVSLNFNY
jgi:outer membrane receptor for ferric coprogen and ferric-rhodotorulic acid